MNNDEKNQLQDTLNRLNKELVDNGKLYLQQTRSRLDDNIKDIINVYSNEIRNIAIISGTIAPFSLTLLQTEKIDVNTPILIFGFSLLIINIIVTQFFLKKQVSNKNMRLASAEINWLFATGNLQNIEKNSSVDGSEFSEYIKNIEIIDKFLGLDSINTDILQTRANLMKINNIAFIIFSAGTLCIIFSVLINPFILFILSI